MRLGTKAASPFETLDDRVLAVVEEFATDEEVAEAEKVPLDEDEISIFWEDLRKEALSRKRLFAVRCSVPANDERRGSGLT